MRMKLESPVPRITGGTVAQGRAIRVRWRTVVARADDGQAPVVVQPTASCVRGRARRDARGCGATFEWINHTYAHHVLTAMTYADATAAIVENNEYAVGAGLAPFSVENLVTPEISGLDNAEAMRAIYDTGVRQLVSDTSVEGQGNPSPNAGYWLPSFPQLLAIPRRPNGLAYNVSLPAEWIVKYGATRGGMFTYDQVIAAVSDVLLRYLLRGENDPWMFHQASVPAMAAGRACCRSCSPRRWTSTPPARRSPSTARR